MHRRSLRPAIAMIELIFALVIIGLVMMSAPQLISTATKSGYVTIQQEGIGEAASRISMIMSYPWDEENVDDSVFNVILKTDSPASDLEEANRTVGAIGFILEGYRRGTPSESLRNFKATNNARLSASTVANLGPDTGDEDDIDDFDGSIGLRLEGVGTGADYIEPDASIVTEITYVADATAGGSYNVNNITFDIDFAEVTAGTRNIKGITTTLTSAAASPDELNKTIILRAFSCNIGAYKLEERDF